MPIISFTKHTLVRMKIEVNGEQIFSNYPADMTGPPEESEDYK